MNVDGDLQLSKSPTFISNFQDWILYLNINDN